MAFSTSRAPAWAVTAALAACAAPPVPPEPTPPSSHPSRPSPPPPGVSTSAVAPDAAASSSEDTDVQTIEVARSTVRSTTEWLASGLDSWFGDKPFSQGGKVRDGRISLSVLKRQDEKADYRLRFNARVRLPNIEEKTYLFIGRDNPRDLVTDRPSALSSQQRLQPQTAADRAFFAGVGRPLDDHIDARLGFRGGLKPYAQVRYTRQWPLTPDDLIEFRETLFWSVDDRFGSTTSVSYDHDVTPTLTGRWLSSVTVTRAHPDHEWHSSLSAFQSFGRRRLLTLEVLATGLESTGVAVNDFGVQTRWEQPVYKQWLLSEFVVGHFWPRRDQSVARGKSWALGLGLKMEF